MVPVERSGDFAQAMMVSAPDLLAKKPLRDFCP
jgi:hypothetical protein